MDTRTDMIAHGEFVDRLRLIAQFETRSGLLAEFRLISVGCWTEYKTPSKPPFGRLAPDDWRKAHSQIEKVIQSLQGLHYHVVNVERIERKIDRLIKRFRDQTLAASDDSGRFWWGLT